MLLLIILLIIMSDNLLFDFDNLVQGSYPKGLNYAQAQNPLNTEEKCKLFSKKADAITYSLPFPSQQNWLYPWFAF